MTKEQVIELYRKLFGEDKKFCKIVSKEIIDWVEEIVIENYSKAINDEIRSKIIFKINHTKKVVEAGWEIQKKSKELNLNLLLVSLVCFLHDIGRFPQVLNNTFSDIKSRVDHGNLAVEMINDKNLKSLDFGDKNIITEAIWWHNKKEYEGKNVYAKLVRDADKIALFREFERLEEDATSEGLLGNKISTEVLNEFKLHNKMTNDLVKSRSEWLLYMHSWLWDLNLEASKRIALTEKYADIIDNKLKEAETLVK